jgi:formylglycine-generating enzyme required for sulfatase activity
VDVYEAALVVVATGEPWSPYWNPGSTPVRAVSLAGAVPQGHVSGLQAAAACASAGKRLCTDAEWLRACRGPSLTTYPYGDTYQAGACNDTRATSPLVELFGTTDAWIYAFGDHPCLNQLPASLTAAGARPSCASAEGIRDLAGNLNEWTSDPAGTLRGGSYLTGSLNGAGCLSVTTAHDARFHDHTTGFRCCAGP